MASDFKKPNLVHTLFPEEIPKKMWPLPVGELFFVGPSMCKKLEALGIHTIGDVAASNPQLLVSHFKKHGELIWNYANGFDIELPVNPKLPIKALAILLHCILMLQMLKMQRPFFFPSAKQSVHESAQNTLILVWCLSQLLIMNFATYPVNVRFLHQQI